MSAPNPLTAAPPRRHRALWTVIAIVAGLVVLIPVGMYLLLVIGLGFAPHQPTVGEAFAAAQQYDKAIQQHDYATAYSFVAPGATITVDGQPHVMDSAQTLASLAQAADQQNGAIAAYTPTDGSFEQGKSIVDMTMHVTRGGAAYDIHMQIGLTNGKWSILRTDNI